MHMGFGVSGREWFYIENLGIAGLALHFIPFLWHRLLLRTIQKLLNDSSHSYTCSLVLQSSDERREQRC